MSPDSEEALQESEDGYRALFEESLDGIFMTRPDGTVLDANPVACAMLGMTKEEICAAGRTGLVESSPEIGELVQDRDRTGKAAGELTLIRGDGTRFLAEFSSAVLPDSTGPRRSFVIFRDITERKRVEEALRLTQFSVDGAADYVFWMSPSGRILYVNDSACKRLDYSRDELLNLSVWDITVGSTPEDRRARWQEIKRRGSLMFEREHLTKGGETFPVEIIANYFEYQGLELNCSFSRDITERKKAE